MNRNFSKAFKNIILLVFKLAFYCTIFFIMCPLFSYFWGLSTYRAVRNCCSSLFEQEDQVTLPGPKTGDIRYLLESQWLPEFDSPSWFMPRLWPISWAMTYTDSKLWPSLMVQLYSGWHIPETQAKPFLLEQK